MEGQPSLGLLLVLAILERIINDDSQVISRSPLALQSFEIALLDEDDALLIACGAAISIPYHSLIDSILTLVFVEEGNSVVLLRVVGKALRPLNLDLNSGKLISRNEDLVSLFNNHGD